jgi:hypothetical protein
MDQYHKRLPGFFYLPFDILVSVNFASLLLWDEGFRLRKFCRVWERVIFFFSFIFFEVFHCSSRFMYDFLFSWSSARDRNGKPVKWKAIKQGLVKRP